MTQANEGPDPRTDRILALLGSHEFEPWADDIDRRLIEAARQGPVAIVPTASWPDGPDTFEGWGRKGLEHFRRLGVPARVVPLRTREDAFDRDLATSIGDVSLVYFSGGKPSYLASVLSASPFWREVERVLQAGAAYAGCSAGACVLGEMAPDSVTERLAAPEWSPGLSLLGDIVVCPHWDTLDEHEPGMQEFTDAAVPDDCTLLAIDERTALVLEGDRWDVAGQGSVRLGRRGNWVRHSAGDSFRPAPGEADVPTELVTSSNAVR